MWVLMVLGGAALADGPTYRVNVDVAVDGSAVLDVGETVAIGDKIRIRGSGRTARRYVLDVELLQASESSAEVAMLLWCKEDLVVNADLVFVPGEEAIFTSSGPYGLVDVSLHVVQGE